MPRVLIIEDDPKIVEAIEKTLSMASGYTTRWIAEPAKALGEAVDSKPDLILLDVRMPGGDGRVVLKSLKTNAATSAIPVIMLTGMSSEGDKVLALNLGADDYVVKPFSMKELLARVDAVLRRTCERAAPADQRPLPGGRVDFKPGRPGHDEVQQQQPVVGLERQFHARVAVGGLQCLIAGIFQHIHDAPAHGGVIFDHEQGGSGHGAGESVEANDGRGKVRPSYTHPGGASVKGW